MYSSVKFFEPTTIVGPLPLGLAAAPAAMYAAVNADNSPTIRTARHFFLLIPPSSSCVCRLQDGRRLFIRHQAGRLAQAARRQQPLQARKREVGGERERRDDDRRSDDTGKEVRRLVEDDVAERAAADEAGERRSRERVHRARPDAREDQ